MASNHKVFEFNTHTETIAALSASVIENISQCLSNQSTCQLAVAGGNTPKPFFKALSETQLPWQKINITLTDERWVDQDHGNSNEKMLKQYLLKSHAESACFIPLKNSEPSPELGLASCEKSLANNMKPLNIVVLGMGDDGHFASIFPNMDNTQALLDLNNSHLCMPAHPKGKPVRMSLTLSYLASADHVYLLITGHDKKAIIEKTLNDSWPSNEPLLPIVHLMQAKNLHIFWNE